MYLKILAHPVLVNLNFHMPLTMDLSHPLILLVGENGSGKSTLLHACYYAFRQEKVEGFIYGSALDEIDNKKVFLFDAEMHNPRHRLEYFEDKPEMKEFLQKASHGQVMLSLFRETFPNLPDGTTLLLDEPEMALSPSNQRRIVKMMMELVDQKGMRIVCATHSEILRNAKETYIINLDNAINRNVPTTDMGIEGQSTIQ